MPTNQWKYLWWVLFCIWVGAALLDMNHIRAGVLTSYGADLTLPAWLYIATRSLDNPSRKTILRRIFGRTPEFAASVVIGASFLTEVSQYFWPRGFFSGTFDPLDILAYVVGIAICYVFDRVT